MTTLTIGYKSNQTDSKRVGRPIVGGGGTEPTAMDGILRGRMVIRVLGKKQFYVIPYAPRSITYNGIAPMYEEVPRDGGRTPLYVKSAEALDRISFDLFFGHTSWEKSVMRQLNGLKNIARSKKACMINFSSWERGLWRISSMTVTSEQRVPNSNEISRATVQIEFTKIGNPRKSKGPASGGFKGPKGEGDKDKDKIPNRYKVKKGDTLMKIGMRFYDSDKAWKRIAKKNKIKNPRKDKKLKPGRILKMPG